MKPITTTLTPCICDLSHEICLGGAECGKNIPHGIVAFKNPISDTVDKEGYKLWGVTYEDWAQIALKNKWSVHTISVDGTEWSVGEECFMGYEEFIIRRLEWSENKFSEGGGFWCAYREGDTIGHGVKMWLRKLQSPTTGKDSGEASHELDLGLVRESGGIPQREGEWQEGDSIDIQKGIKLFSELNPTPSKPQGEGLTMEAMLQKHFDKWANDGRIDSPKMPYILAAMKEWGEYRIDQYSKLNDDSKIFSYRGIVKYQEDQITALKEEIQTLKAGMKDGWSDTDMKQAYLQGIRSTRVNWGMSGEFKTWLSEYKSKKVNP